MPKSQMELEDIYYAIAWMEWQIEKRNVVERTANAMRSAISVLGDYIKTESRDLSGAEDEN